MAKTNALESSVLCSFLPVSTDADFKLNHQYNKHLIKFILGA